MADVKVVLEGVYPPSQRLVRVVQSDDGWATAEGIDGVNALGNRKWSSLPDDQAAVVIATAALRQATKK